MAGRTFYPRINDSWGQWLNRLVFGTKWEEAHLHYKCLPSQHEFKVTYKWSPNDPLGSNMAMLYATTRSPLCPVCGSPHTMIVFDEKEAS